ncbi:Auxin efflux carrier [Parasponia andersonii]|uniref:Auxin efflux carrier n=1 Tax=Parasponia andersonii TaxID=3476 RepID=A0A2P5ACL7_PARAD|nr:Auxin efflux carrier [Parasponia andersonii]
MEFLRLFVTASIPVLKVLLVTALGSYLALDHVSILGEETRKHLNTIVFYVFSPALVCSNLAKTITYESMIKLWFMPLNVLITFFVGSILGWIVIQFTRPPQHLRGLILGCSAAGNLGNLPLIIIPALCKEEGSPFGDPDVCYTYGMAYVSLSMALVMVNLQIGAICLWSYVYNIVRLCSRSIKDIPVSKYSRESSNSSDAGSSIEQPLLLSSPELVPPGDDAGGYALPRTVHEGKAEIVGFIIGVVPQIRKSMIGGSAPLRVIQDSASLLGDGAIPALTLIIGGNLLKGLRGSGVQKSLVVGIIVTRYIALPLIGSILIVKGAQSILIWCNLIHCINLFFYFTICSTTCYEHRNYYTIVWSRRERMFRYHALDLCLGINFTYYLVHPFFMWLVG